MLPSPQDTDAMLPQSQETDIADPPATSAAFQLNRMVLKRLQKALEADPEVDLTSKIPSTYADRLAARKSEGSRASNLYALVLKVNLILCSRFWKRPAYKASQEGCFIGS